MIKIKKNYCELNYNKRTNMWNIYIETEEESIFLENRSKIKSIKKSKKIAKDKSVFLYIYDKKNLLIEKIDYSKILCDNIDEFN